MILKGGWNQTWSSQLPSLKISEFVGLLYIFAYVNAHGARARGRNLITGCWNSYLGRTRPLVRADANSHWPIYSWQGPSSTLSECMLCFKILAVDLHAFLVWLPKSGQKQHDNLRRPSSRGMVGLTWVHWMEFGICYNSYGCRPSISLAETFGLHS